MKNKVFVARDDWLQRVYTAANVNKEYIMLVNYTLDEARAAAAEARNCILVRLTDNLRGLFPLVWYFALPVIVLDNDTAAMELPSDVSWKYWVDGQELDLEAGCIDCASRVGRSLMVCQPMRGSCSNFMKPFLPIRCKQLHGSYYTSVVGAHESDNDRVRSLLEWFGGHEMQYRVSGEKREMKDACLRHNPFYPPGIQHLVVDEKGVAEKREERELRVDCAKEAARTRRAKKYLCRDCLHDGIVRWCMKNGASQCNGPHYADDFREIADAADPWAVHVLLLSGQEIDMRNNFAFKLCRSLHVIACPAVRSTHVQDRAVTVCRQTRRMLWEHTSYETLCAIKQLAPVNTWPQLAKTPEYQRISPRQLIMLKILSQFMCSTRLSLRTQGFGYYYHDFCSLDIGYSDIRLFYQSSSGSSHNCVVGDYKDLQRIWPRQGSLCAARYAENSMMKSLLLTQKLNMTAEMARKSLQIAHCQAGKKEVSLQDIKEASKEVAAHDCKPKQA